jgi:hypothetical protein
MKPKYILFAITIINLAVWYGCVSDPDLPSDMINAKIPEIKTLQIEDNITATSVTITAEVLKENGEPVVDYGAYWSKTTPIDTINDNKISAGKGKGVFSVTIEGLDNNTQYYIAPYARNKKGIALGEEREINTTSGLGVVSTLDPQNITATTANVGGKIEVKGEGEIIARGIYWSAEANFVQKDSLLSSMQTDSFVCLLSDLSPDSIYYVKAFVKNNFGVFTGGVKSFRTTSGLSEVKNLTCLEIDIFQAVFQAEVTNEGNASVTERGFCWKENELPTIEDDTLVCSSGAGIFQGVINNLLPQTQYRIRAYSINEFGVSYSQDTTFFTKSDYPSVTLYKSAVLEKGTATINAEVLDEGQSVVVESGICWSTTNTMPTIADQVIPVSSGKAPFTAVMENLKGGTTYYVRAYAKNQVKLSYNSGDAYSFTTPAIYTSSNIPALNKIRTQGSTSFFFTETEGYILGGDAGSSYSSELWQYSEPLNVWLDKQDYPNTNVAGQTPVYWNQIAFVFGGKKASQFIHNFYTYSTYKNTWRDLTGLVSNIPDPIAYTAGCEINGSIYYFGGLRTDSVCKDAYMYNPLTGEWFTKTNLPEAQYGGIALTIEDTVYVGLGLTDLNGNTNNKMLWKSTNNGSSWIAVSSIPSGASQIIGGVVYHDHIYVIDNTAQIWQYAPSNDVWTQKSKLTIMNNNVHCIYVLNDKIYVGLGTGSSKFVTYDPYWDN